MIVQNEFNAIVVDHSPRVVTYLHHLLCTVRILASTGHPENLMVPKLTLRRILIDLSWIRNITFLSRRWYQERYEPL